MEEGKRSQLRLIAVGVAGVSAVLLFIGGTAFGIWFSQNFSIVPKGQMAAVQEAVAQGKPLEQILKEQGLEGVDPATLDALVKQAGLGSVAELNQRLQAQDAAAHASMTPVESTAVMPAAAPPVAKGPIQYKFTPGEKVHYRMTAGVSGQGMEALGGSPITLAMDSGFDVETKTVAPDGTGDLELRFSQMQMQGDFMGSAFRMQEGPNGSLLQMNGETMVDTAKGVGSTQGLPQMEFFKAPIQMRVGADGVVQEVSGEGGIGGLKELPVFADLEFPEAALSEGMKWRSNIAMPVPGFGAPVNASVINTFMGYQQVAGRRCAVVQQQISSKDKANMLSMPESVLGSAMGISMPVFDLGGTNLVYVDADNGQMVHSEMDLDLKLDLGKALGGAGDLLSEVGKGLTDILGDVPELEGILPSNKGEKNLLQMDLDLKAAVTMVDPATGSPAVAARQRGGEPYARVEVVPQSATPGNQLPGTMGRK